MVQAAESKILDAIAAIFAPVVGLNAQAIYGPGGGAVAGVKEFPDDIGDALPALVIAQGDVEVIGGSGQERQSWSVVGEVWSEYTPRGERYRALIDLKEPMLARAAQYSKGNLAAHGDTEVQSVLVTGFSRIEGRKWQPGDNAPTYLVLPFTLEAKVHRPRQYGAL